MTKATDLSTRMSASGSPATAIRSALLPASIVPISLDSPSRSAALTVAALIAGSLTVATVVSAEESGDENLRAALDQILSDELRHVQFQTEQLTKLSAGRRWPGMAATMGVQRFLYFGTVLAVWFFHRRTIRRGGLSPWGWWKACWREFSAAFTPKTAAAPLPQETWAEEKRTPAARAEPAAMAGVLGEG